MRALLLAVAIFAISRPSLSAEPWTLDRMVRREGERLIVAARPIPDELRNPWPAEWEREFQARGDYILKAQSQKPLTGANTYFENEKRVYGLLMAQVLAGLEATALKALQQEDAQAREWHRDTEGIDFYAAFTLKHQMRKYFYFGDLLDPAYRRRMYEGGRRWTSIDPLRRPHYAFQKRGPGWGPDVMNSWVDVRSTENLFLMRVTSVYLMAEETKNEETRRKYKQILLDYAAALYRVGMGEWDSENYHGHSIAPLLNVYDFARDREVRLAAKASLDWIMASGALKYYRGGFNGPTKRDYNHPQPFGGSAANMLWVYFGDAPRSNEHFESDEVHILTSAYRPPAAVVKLARKQLNLPAELFAAKAHYEATTANQLDRGPSYLETYYLGRTFQLGSLATGTSTGASDVNGFKLLAYDGKEGVADLQCVPGPDPRYVGSPRYTEGKVSADNRVAQNGPIAVWLVKQGTSPWRWVVPQSVGIERKGAITFLKMERTWIALHPLNCSSPERNAAETADISTAQGDKKAEWPQRQVLAATGQGGDYCGFAIEVGEAPTWANFAAFQQAVTSRSKVDVGDLAQGVAGFTSADGRSVRLAFRANEGLPEVYRDGEPHDWSEHAKHLYAAAGKSPPLLTADWQGGKLTVQAGGAAFACSVDADGKVSFAGN